jgi:hypothetical protein
MTGAIVVIAFFIFVAYTLSIYLLYRRDLKRLDQHYKNVQNIINNQPEVKNETTKDKRDFSHNRFS